jgi:hypothetical protein
MNIQTINISAQNGCPIEVLMNTKAPKQTAKAFKESVVIQEKIGQYKSVLSLLERWSKRYLFINTVITSDNPKEVPETLEELKKKYNGTGNITIFSGGSNYCDWSKDTNIALRHRHDLQHMHFNMGMTAQEELELAERLAASVVLDLDILYKPDPETLEMAYKVIKTDFKEQTNYYQKHKDFVLNQGLFLRTCIFNDSSIFQFNTI